MLEIMAEETQLAIRMTPGFEEVDAACQETRKLLDRNGLQEHTFDIMLLAREALVNAVVHGCRKNSHMTVSYGVRLEADFLVLEVEDEGEGFDWQSRLGKEAEITSECGRGLAILTRYSTQMCFNEKGNRLVVRKMIR